MNFQNYGTVMSSEYDSSFRTLCNALEFIDKVQGSVDEEIGFLTMVTVDMSNVEEASALLSEFGEPVPSQGCYITHENVSGQIVVFSYDDAASRESEWARIEQESSAVG